MKLFSRVCVSFIVLVSFVANTSGIAPLAYANVLPDILDATAGVSVNNPSASQMDITAPDRAIINYKSFNIGKGDVVNFYQPSSRSIVLNRVTGDTGMSQIYGSLNANGRVFLINPDGLFFGDGSMVDAPGLVASSLDISDNDFRKGNYIFSRKGGEGAVVQQGSMRIREGGYLALLGPEVRNDGEIDARLSQVILASGEKITLGLDDENDISVVVSEGAFENMSFAKDGEAHAEIPSGLEDPEIPGSGVTNTGRIFADGGRVVLTADRLNGVLDGMVNNSGVIQAMDIGLVNGKVELLAEVGSVINTGSVNAGEVTIDASKDVYIQDVTAERLARITAGGSIIGMSSGDSFDLSATEAFLTAGAYVRGALKGDTFYGNEDNDLFSLNAGSLVMDTGNNADVHNVGDLILSIGHGGNVTVVVEGDIEISQIDPVQLTLEASGSITGRSRRNDLVARDLYLYAGGSIRGAYVSPDGLTQGAITTNAQTVRAVAGEDINLYVRNSALVNARSGGDMKIRVNGDLTAGVITTLSDLDLRASGAIKQGAGQAQLLTGRNLNLTAGTFIGGDGALAINTRADAVVAAAGGDIFLNEADGAVFSLATSGNAVITSGGASTLADMNVGDLNVNVTDGDVVLDGVNTAAFGAEITAANGNINGADADARLVTGEDTYLRAANGTIGLDVPVNVDVQGQLYLDIGARLGAMSGILNGAVNSPAARPVFLGESLAPLYPKGIVQFNGERIWPAPAADVFANTGNGLTPRVVPSFAQVAFLSIPSTYFYHPLSDVDSSAFDGGVAVDQGAFEAIDAGMGVTCSEEDREAGRCTAAAVN